MQYCESDLCEHEAYKAVPVSERSYGDGVRYFCASCESAYATGAQHGTERALERILQEIEARPHLFAETVEVAERVQVAEKGV